jgi:uncharacterized membrane protein
VPQWAEISAAAGQAHVRAPDFSPLAAASPVVQIHVAAAAGAVALGGFLMVGRKGRALHRTLGWIWAMTMVVVAVASLFITNLNPGAWSWIHLLSGWTLIAVPFALFAARKHMVSAHRKTMMGLYYGGLFVAGAFTFVPGRMMWDIFFG